jgi:CBS domain-containing protein
MDMAQEESLLLDSYCRFKLYVFRTMRFLNFYGKFASNTRNPHDKENKGKLISENVIYNEQDVAVHILNPFHILKTYHSYWKESVKSIAETMVKYKIGSVVIEKNHLPIGIITDKFTF